MRLFARPLLNFANINSFSYGNQWIVRAGDPLTLYFQLFDLDQGPASVIGAPNPFGFQGSPTLSGNVGLRYIAGIGVSNQPVQVTLTFPSIDDTKVITAIAVQDPDDGSIFKVSLSSNQTVNSGAVQFAIAEGSAIRRFNVLNLMTVEFPQADGSC